jgi:hypothetical protein
MAEESRLEFGLRLYLYQKQRGFLQYSLASFLRRPNEWDAEQLCGSGLRSLTAPVVFRCGLDIRVAGHPLHRSDVSAGIEQITDETAPQIVRREVSNASLFADCHHHVKDSL